MLARLLVGPLSRPDTQEPADAVDRDDDEVAASSVSVNRVTLARHLTAARDRAVQIADAIGRVDFRRTRSTAEQRVHRLDIRTPSIRQKVRNLSGARGYPPGHE